MNVKQAACQILLMMLTLALPLHLRGQISLPTHDVSDGTFNPTTNQVVDLSLAVARTWSDPSPVPGQGVYDYEKWAVVFKFASVNIPANVTNTFRNHPSRAPVVWLVNGDVTINGVIALNGQDASTNLVSLTEPGPGGFRGGAGPDTALPRGPGMGPGGSVDGAAAVYGGYYGNARIVPLIGGSGGSGSPYVGETGGAGGGALLIAATGTITISGIIQANGGNGYDTGHGSGGGIRLVANKVLGNGRVEAVGPETLGRIRLEANEVSQVLSLNPLTVALPPSPVVIWPGDDAPTVRVVSIGGQAAPVDPRANFLPNNGDDLTLMNSGPVPIIIETKNLPTNSIVTTSIKPRNGSPLSAQAQYSSGDSLVAIWQLTTNVPLGHFIVQVRAVAP